MSILSLVTGLFSCKKETVYEAKDITKISICCGHMDYSCCYSFFMNKTESGWQFSCDCAINREGSHIEIENCPITEAEAEELLAIIQEQDIIDKIKSYKKTKIKWHVNDETTYGTSIYFRDGQSISANTNTSHEVSSFFYQLAERYADASLNPEA